MDYPKMLANLDAAIQQLKPAPQAKPTRHLVKFTRRFRGEQLTTHTAPTLREIKETSK